MHNPPPNVLCTPHTLTGVTTPPPPLRKSTRLTPTNVKTEDEEDVREKKMEDTVRKPKPTLTETRSLDKKPQTPDKGLSANLFAYIRIYCSTKSTPALKDTFPA